MFVSVLVLGVAAAAQTPSQLDRVNVVRGTDDIRVEMSSRGTVTPKLSTLDSPARVVVDLPETVKATGQTRIAVGADGVKSVRIGTDGLKNPTTRIVVDLDQACAYELTPGPAGKLVLTLHANAVAKTASETKIVAASSPVPASPAASPFAPRVAQAETTPVVPTDFVVVQPAYQAKNEAAKNDTKPTSDVKNDVAADEPTVRAQEAAARFSDKTAAELLPVSAHSTQAQNHGSLDYSRGQSGGRAEGPGRSNSCGDGTEIHR